jgi:nucleotide-binding universal stress UspA family protein
LDLSTVYILGAIAAALLLGYQVGKGRPVELPKVAHTAHGAGTLRRIMVPIRGFDFEHRALELACRLGEKQKSEIILVYVLEVPLTMGLGTPLPEQEEKATEALAAGAKLVRAHRLAAVQRLERAREAGRGIIKAAKEMQVDLVVVGLDPNRGVAVEAIGPATELLLRRGDFEVLIDRTPPKGFE